MFVMIAVAEELFYCDKCDKMYKYMGNLQRHKKYECGQAPKFVCTYDGCSYKTKHKANLKLHVHSKHK